MKSILWKFFAVFWLTTASFSAIAQPTVSASGALSGDDPDGTFSPFGDAYGVALDTWKDWVFVGAPRETTFRNGSDFQDGAVYIYRRDDLGNFNLAQKLTRAGTSAVLGDRFGGGISADNGWLFIGSSNGLPPFDFAGLVDVYALNKATDMWELRQTLTAPVPKSGGLFGARTQASHIAFNKNAKIALIGEINNFPGGVGEAHSFVRNKDDEWEFVQSIPAPANVDGFADDVVFIGGKRFLVGGTDFSDDGTEIQGFAFVFKGIGTSGDFDPVPEQTLAGPIYAVPQSFPPPVPPVPPECNSVFASFSIFGSAGMDAGGDVVAIADPCFSGTAGNFTGAVNVYRRNSGSPPLTFETTIEGNAANLFFGAQVFGSRFGVAVNKDGDGLLIGSALSPVGFLHPAAVGADVQYWTYDAGTGVWSQAANLNSPVAPGTFLRMFGDTVWFTDEDTALVRHNQILPGFFPVKGDLTIYDLP